MAELLLGPVLRHAGRTDATVWIETDAPCEVEILGARARTFEVGGHHYALVEIDGLDPGEHAYAVALDGVRRWPEEGSRFPPSTIRTIDPSRRLRIAFGSCRVTAPHRPPYTLDPRRHALGCGLDALHELGVGLASEDGARRPDLLLLLGDQVYADALSPATLERIRRRRDISGPHGDEVANFEEYTWLYHEAWGEPVIRWLLASIPSVMIFDDHDVHDDWNISESWVREVRAEPWWEERIVGALMSYWLYQHLGNLSLAELAQDDLFALARRGGALTDALRRFALEASRSTSATRWSYRRELGPVRLVVIDSRASRVLEGGRRSMLDAAEWAWLDQQLAGGVDHLLVATTLPLALLPALHHVEAWSEAVCRGAWSGRAARIGEWLRRRADLDHWAAFGESFERLVGMLRAVARGARGRPPAALIVLSGDVHHTYVAEFGRDGSGAQASRIYQAVCSPIRNPLGRLERAALRLAATRPIARAARELARAAGVPPPSVQWRLVCGPSFGNHVALLELDVRSASFAVEGPAGAAPLGMRLR